MSSEPLRRLDQRILQVIYNLVYPLGKWPTFRAVDLRLDRQLGIADTQVALLAVPAIYLHRPWQPTWFNDADEVRLTLRGIAACEGGLDALDLVTRFLRWAAQEEQSRNIDDADLVLTSDEFAAELGWRLESEAVSSADVAEQPGETPQPLTSAAPAVDGGRADSGDGERRITEEIERARAAMVGLRVGADLVTTFWTGAGYKPDRPWQWQYTINRQRVRDYRSLRDVVELLDRQEPMAVPGRTPTDAPDLSVNAGSPTIDPDEALTQRSGTGGIDMLLSVLREEITAASGDFVKAEFYDEAIFAAYRYVESSLQQRTGLTNIGSTLVELAFRDSNNPIKVSGRDGDTERLVQIFSGPLGLFKGDRSHNDKPALPCRSMRECLRQLAHASTLLDLLDRDIAAAPHMRGYDHNQRTLTLWVERATPQTRVLLDEHPREVLTRVPGAITIDISDVPSGDHDLVLVDGLRQSPGRPLWLTREPGRHTWYRVDQINIPLFVDAGCVSPLNVSGIKLAVLESGVSSQRIVPTAETYRVGDYVTHQWDNANSVGPAWVREHRNEQSIQIFNCSLLFSGEPETPAHPPRTMRVTLQPDRLRLRVNEKVPLRALGHLTDGTATWTETLDDPTVVSGEDRVAFFKGGVLHAKQPGITVLRLKRDGLFAQTTVEVAAHARGTQTDWITGLPPVAGLAWTPDALIISTRESKLWRVGADGKFVVAAGLPLQPPVYGGSDTIAAANTGDLAARFVGHGDVLILHASDNYSSSRWVKSPDPRGTIMALTWDANDLVLGLNTGGIWRIEPDETASQVAHVEGTPVSLATAEDALLALTGGAASQLWRIPKTNPDQVTGLFTHTSTSSLSAVGYAQGQTYIAEFHEGRIFRLAGGKEVVIADGLVNPNAITAAPDGTIYIAEFGRGAVRRVLP